MPPSQQSPPRIKKPRSNSNTEQRIMPGRTMKPKMQSGHPFTAAAHWNLEQSYENRPCSKKRRTKEKERTRLPIKTATGIVQVPNLPTTGPGSESEDDADEEGQVDLGNAAGKAETLPVAEPAEKPISLRRRILAAKEELASIAASINEDPEERIGLLKRLADISSEGSAVQVRMLALGTQLTVYKNLIPGYRIRALTDEEMRVKATKEVRKVRGFEQALVAGYSGYVRMLATLARAGRSSVEEGKLADVAVSCACALLTAVPHFNFRAEILGIVVARVSSGALDGGFARCREALEELFRDDEEGTASAEAVRLVSRMMRARGYRVHESVLNTFLSLRLLSELDVKGSASGVCNPRKRKKEHQFRTKKARKLEKERRASEREMLEADAAVSLEEREHVQSETLKVVFATYFRILKEKPPGLTGAALEGLARYARLINADFFGDLLVALKELISATMEEGKETREDENEDVNRNAAREALLCVITAFALLSGQGEATPIDLTFFTTHLYATLPALSLSADLELTTKSLRLPDPHSPSPPPLAMRVNLSTEIELLLRALSAIFFSTTHQKSTTPLRLAAFTKRLTLCALHTPAKSALAILGVLSRMATTGQHGRGGKLAGLFSTEEARGDGAWDGFLDEPEGSNPFAGTVWETVLLRRHYCPMVAEAAGRLPGLFARGGQ